MRDWYNLSWNEIVRELNTDIFKGLSEENIEENRDRYGENVTIIIKDKNFIIIFLKYLLKLYSLCGILVSSLLIYINQFATAISILFIILISSSFFAIRNYKNDNKLKHLINITPQKALVLRNGKTITINVSELVVGDIVYLEQGDIVPGDVRLIECKNLKIKESAITGDNQIIDKYETKIEDKEITLSEMKNMVFKSSFVIEGSGKGVTVAVGDKAQIDNITKGLLEVNYVKSTVEKVIFRLLNIFSVIFLITSITIGIYNFLLKINLEKTFEFIAMSYYITVPIELVFVAALVSFIIKRIMWNKGIDIEGLSSIELLASNNIIFTDKVGTLSEEAMFIDSFYTNGKVIQSDVAEIEDDKHNVDRMLSIGLLCNDSKANDEYGKGNLIEKAIISFGLSQSITKKDLDLEHERIFQIPYDMDKRVKTTLNKMEDKYRANVMGSVDKLLERCTHIMKNGMEVELTPKDIVDIKDADLSLSLKSLYVIGVAYRNFNYQPSVNENVESNLVFVGLIGFENPTKENYIEIINYCRTLAIKPIIITDENKISAQVFGQSATILNRNDIVLSGVEMDNMTEEELLKFVERVGLFSRITQNHKFKIASSLNKLGYKVAITGNKFTDLPSFRAANIGIAMGRACTQMAKKLGDIFVRENSLWEILSLIEESRKTLKSIKNIIYFNFRFIIIELFCLGAAFNLLGENIISLSPIIGINFITIILSSLIIFNGRDIYAENKYENLKLDIKLSSSISLGFFIYIFFLSAVTVLGVYFGNSIDPLLGRSNMFFILNLSAISTAFYYVDFKNVVKCKASILILILNFVVFIGFIKLNYYMNNISFENVVSNLKILAFVVILNTITLKFTKWMNNNK